MPWARKGGGGGPVGGGPGGGGEEPRKPILLSRGDMGRPDHFTMSESEWPGTPLARADPHFVRADDGRRVCRSEPGHYLLICSHGSVVPEPGHTYRVTATARMVRPSLDGRPTNVQVGVVGLKPDGSNRAVYGYAADLRPQPLGAPFEASQILVYDGAEPLQRIKARVLFNHWMGPPFSDAQYELLELKIEDVTLAETTAGHRVARLERMEGDAPLLAKLAGFDSWVMGHEKRIGELERRVTDIDARSQSHVSHLNVQIGSLTQALTTLLDALDPDLPAVKDAGEQLSRLRGRRRDLRERNVLPLGEPGLVEGMRVARGSRRILWVVWAGRSDVFGMLPFLVNLGFDVLHLIDDQNVWYVNGIPGARSHAEMIEVTRRAIAEFDVDRVVFFGASMGAYGAMRAAPELKPDLVAAFCPQTRYLTEGSIPGGNLARIEPTAPDIRPLIADSGVPTHIWVAKSERDNPPSESYWDDHAHLQGLEAAPNVHIHAVDCHHHVFSMYLARAGRLDASLETIAALAAGTPPPLDPDHLL